jgi:hypothetical protein
MYITLITLIEGQPRDPLETDGILDRDIRAASATTHVALYYDAALTLDKDKSNVSHRVDINLALLASVTRNVDPVRADKRLEA